MKLPRFRLLLAAALCASLAPTVRAAYVRGDLVWKCDFTPAEAAQYKLDRRHFDAAGHGVAYEPREGANGDGAMRFRCPDQKHKATVTFRPDVPVTGLVLVEADVKGVEIGPGFQAWNGPKVMLPYRKTSIADVRTGKMVYPQLPGETGSFDWKTWTMVYDFESVEDGPDIVLGLELGAGEMLVDSVRIWRAVEMPDDEVAAPFNAAAAAIPRGAFAGRHNPEAVRGAMSGGDLSEESLRNLADWGANLLRLQIGGNELRHGESVEAYFAALSNKLDWCETIMDRCARNGIHVIVDLHAGPGCVSTKHAANIIPDDYDAAELAKAWEIIAARFKDHPATYAYDILNEPSVAPATWVRVCEEVMRATRRIDPRTPFVVETAKHWYEGENVIYSPHFYSPHPLTHNGVGGPTKVRWSYPGYINGVYWDKEQMRVDLRSWIEFQREHPGARILVGEFSCILWSKGSDAWIRDAIDLFEEYGWSWCYHAYREWPAWDVEYTNTPDWTQGKWVKATEDTPRKLELLRGLSYNRGPGTQPKPKPAH